MRLVLCDDNRILCEALADALEAWGHQVVAITTTAADGVAAVRAHRPDAMMLDLHIPPGTVNAEAAGEVAAGIDGAEGLRAVAAVRQGCAETAVLMLSSRVDRATWSAAMKMGVAGFLGKNQDLGEIAAALEAIAAGGVVFDPTASGPASSQSPSQGPGSICPLTSREKEVLRRIVAGQSTGQMAGEMNIAVNTLRTYVKNVLAKLGAHSRLQAAALATRENLLDERSA
jgi:DNA-binding NarL/FixJ family response regulator